MFTTRIEYDEGKAKKRYGNSNGGGDKQPRQKIKPSGDYCAVSKLCVGVGDPRKMTAIIGEKEIIFLRDKMVDLLSSNGLPVPSELYPSAELMPGKKFFYIENYLRGLIEKTKNQPLSETEPIITAAMTVADRCGVKNIDFGSIVAPSKPYVRGLIQHSAE